MCAESRFWVVCVALALAACATGRGALDPSFDGAGRVTANFINPNEAGGSVLQDGHDVLQAIKLDSQGRILAIGTAAYSYHCRGEIAVARYTSSGAPDNTFGFPSTNQTRITYVNPDLYSVDVVDADVHGDSIIVLVHTLLNWKTVCGSAGGAPIIPAGPGARDDGFRIHRITDAGNLDPAFGWNDFHFGAGETQGHAVVAMPDGKVVVCGTWWHDSRMDMAIARYNSAGGLDTSFQSGGKWTPDFGGPTSFAWQLAVQGDGKVVIGGGLSGTGGAPPSTVLIRLLPDGTEDSSFGTAGRVILTGAGGGVKHIALQNVAGQTDDAIIAVTHDKLLKLSPDGSAASGFGTNGIVTRPSSLWPGGVAVDANGTIFVTGTDVATLSLARMFFLEAYLPTGDPDLSFRGGRFTTTVFASSGCYTTGGTSIWSTTYWGGGLLLQDGRVIIGGTTEPELGTQIFHDFALLAYRTIPTGP